MDYGKEFKRRGVPVLCLTEHGNRSDVWQQAEVAAKMSDESFTMRPIAGAEAYFVPDRNPDLKDNRNMHLILLAKNNTGLRQMNAILSEANISGFYGKARVDFDLLSRLDYRNFLVTTACIGGPIGDEQGEQLCHQLHELFRENFYLEIQHHPQQAQVEHNAKVLNLYRKHGYPLIYGTDSHYINHEDAILRKELLLSSGIKNGYEDEFDLYLPTPQEAFAMLKAQNLFSDAQIGEAMANTMQLCDWEGVSFTKERKFPISRPDLTMDQRNKLYQRMVCNGYIQKAGMPSKEEAAELHAEMNTIIETGSADYFIGLHDMLEEGVRLGGKLTTTSRGSACGFATNFALGFTSINRLKTPVKMYPERFISREKLLSGSMPDVDSNIANVEAFEEAGRKIFGEHSCYPMIAYGKTKALSAFKMLARARNLDFDTSNAVSKQIALYELDRKHAIENNQDDPDYSVDDDIIIDDYVDQQYIQLIRDSKQYQNIITSVSPHPCAHLVYHKDLREEIGVISLKAKTGKKERQLCLLIDGTTADNYGYVKSDLLRVDVVKIINETFESVSQPVLTADELVAAVKDDPRIWDLYAKGFTMGLNQCEKPKTTERVMRFKPQNTVELAAFIAAIRPGAKSLVDGFVARQLHSYGIPAMDEMLKLHGASGITGKSSFLFYDEQVMTLAKSAGIPPADANALIKAIKKKKMEQVTSYKERFIPGFIKYLQEEQGADEDLAEKTAQDVWTVIQASASYLFNASHAYAMCLDSLYGAYLKLHYPYEFYTTMLKLYSNKGNKEKISQIIQEMKRYANIRMLPGRFGQDNRDWYIDKEAGTISQSLSSIKFVSKSAAEDLYTMSSLTFDTFTDVLRHLQMETCLDSRQIKALIYVGYFNQFGKTGKLMAVFYEFFEGKNKLTKQIKSFEKRLSANRETESNIANEHLPVFELLKNENNLLGLCMSVDSAQPDNMYFVEEVEDKYGIKAKLYSVSRGTTGLMKVSKKNYDQESLSQGKIIVLDQWKKRQRSVFKDGKRVPLGDEFDLWLEKYHQAS
jgi:DNA polymerase III alpha subunit